VKISFDQLAVLVSAGQYFGRFSKDALAREVEKSFSSPLKDRAVFSKDIDDLVRAGYLGVRANRTIELTQTGWSACMEMAHHVESLRAMVGGARFDFLRRG